MAHFLSSVSAQSICSHSLFRKVLSLFPDAGAVVPVAIDSAVSSGNSSRLGTTAMAAAVGTIGESF